MSMSADRRAVAVRTGPQRRADGGGDWWFYPLVLIVAAGLIAASLGAGAWVEAARPQRPALDGGALVLGPHALARGLESSADTETYIAREYGVSARAVRIAVRPDAPAPASAMTGARILIDPAATAPLAGRMVEVELQVRRLSVTAAGGVAVSLQNGGPVTWVSAPLPAASGPVTLAVPAPEGAGAGAIGIRMLSDRSDFNYGAEISRVVLRPQP